MVEENSLSTGKPIRSTYYYDGKLYSSTNYAKKRNGLDEKVTYYYDDKEYVVTQFSSNRNIQNYISLSKDLKFVDIDVTRTSKNKEQSYDLKFYNGALLSATERKKTTMPNLLGREPLSDNDLIPAKKYNISIVTPDFEGEKTFYSNGAVESIKTTDGTAYFNPDGKVVKLVSKNIELESQDDGELLITEFLDENKKRITFYEEDTINVQFYNGDKYKDLTLTSKLVPIRYEEAIIKEDGDLDTQFSYYYDGSGFLDEVYKS